MYNIKINRDELKSIISEQYKKVLKEYHYDDRYEEPVERECQVKGIAWYFGTEGSDEQAKSVPFEIDVMVEGYVEYEGNDYTFEPISTFDFKKAVMESGEIPEELENGAYRIEDIEIKSVKEY